MDRQALKENLKKPSRIQELKGELKVSMDGESITYPPDWFNYAPGLIAMGFGKRAPSGAMEDGIAFVIRGTDFGKEITLPGNGASTLELISGNEFYEVESGTLTVDYDEVRKLAFGNFNVIMKSDSPFSKLTGGIFSVEEKAK